MPEGEVIAKEKKLDRKEPIKLSEPEVPPEGGRFPLPSFFC